MAYTHIPPFVIGALLHEARHDMEPTGRIHTYTHIHPEARAWSRRRKEQMAPFAASQWRSTTSAGGTYCHGERAILHGWDDAHAGCKSHMKF